MRSKRGDPIPSRHVSGQDTCPGHPRLRSPQQDADGRHKAGHDAGRLARLVSACGVSTLLLAAAIDPGCAAEVTFVLRLENGRLPQNMRRIRVRQNDVVKLQWSSDRPMTIHLHGYDLERRIVPGEVSDMTFIARATGRFTVEPHLPSSSGHGHGEVLVTVEVHP
jgi:hypothetical protein